MPAQFDTEWDYWQALRVWDREQILSEVKKEAGSGAGAGIAGIGFGSAMAMILSWQLNHSILWMIVHGICSWFYVIYRAWQGNY